MTKFKKWLISRFLPAYAKQAAADNEEYYKKEIRRLTTENERLKAYINGIESGMKAIRKVQIINSGRGD